MNLNDFSIKQRVLLFIPLCWLSIVAFFSWDSYTGFNSQIFFGAGIFPIFFIWGLNWIIQGVLKERPSFFQALGHKCIALVKSNLLIQVSSYALGYLAFKTFGYTLLLPCLGFFMAMSLITKIGKAHKYSKQIRIAFSILAAQTLWMLIGILFTDNALEELWLDFFLMVGVLAGLLAIPHSKIFRSIAIILQMVALAYNISQFSETPSSQEYAMIMHIILRSAFVFFIVRSFIVLSNPSVDHQIQTPAA